MSAGTAAAVVEEQTAVVAEEQTAVVAEAEDEREEDQFDHPGHHLGRILVEQSALW